MSDYLHACDDMLQDSLGVVKISNVKLLKKKSKKFHEYLSKFICEKLKEFECLKNDLDAKLVLSNKLVNDLKFENESLKMHAKCLIAKPIAKVENILCCNHVMKPNFVPIVCSTSKDKLMYIPPHKRNHKVGRTKPLFRSQSKDLYGSKFVPTCYHCGVISHIRP